MITFEIIIIIIKCFQRVQVLEINQNRTYVIHVLNKVIIWQIHLRIPLHFMLFYHGVRLHYRQMGMSAFRSFLLSISLALFQSHTTFSLAPPLLILICTPHSLAVCIHILLSPCLFPTSPSPSVSLSPFSSSQSYLTPSISLYLPPFLTGPHLSLSFPFPRHSLTLAISPSLHTLFLHTPSLSFSPSLCRFPPSH
ncbi:hypothetical protein EGW08_021684 [Elysia chlorotica]|uniref:Uncharacterized protein n=1 Tax=Elysia chlorotica TaxID=188477 RepID=A0A3S0ZM27_ELYCH|nr:hypothetical protein EGW08_021684 [Elysia chlorotica]